jgi:uncharacterized protein (DUF58 family)
LYSPGDSVSRIDWRKSARSGKTLIRETEWAATNTIFVWASQSPGMDFRSHLAPVSKKERAAVLALTIATLAVRAGERTGVLDWQQAPGHTRLVLRRMAAWYSDENPSPPTESLPLQMPLPAYASCVLFGDFLEPLEKIRNRLASIADARLTGHVVQITDPAEETFPYQGRTEFLEVAGSGKFTAGRAETLRQEYTQALARHRDGLQQLVRQLGWSFTVHHTDQSPHPLLMALYTRLGERVGPTVQQKVG